MRLLREWRHYDRQGISRPKSQSDRSRHPASDVERSLPMSFPHKNDSRRSPLRERSESMKNLSRRDFLKTSGALIVTFSLAPKSLLAQRLDGASSNQVDGWLAINGDGTVTAYTGKCELGHGLYTAQTQLVAEELSVPLDRVKLIQCDTALTPDQGTTSGAQSHPTNFNQGALALAGATAREVLFDMASKRFGVAADQLTVKDGVISVKADTAKKVTYAELVGGKKFNLTLNNRAKRKSPNDWTVLGTPVPRIEIPAMATGQFEYVHNVRLPGMLHGQVVRPPTYGSTLVSVDENSVKGFAGIVKVVVKKDFVGIVDEKLGQAAKVIKATYHYPYQMHGSFGTSCAVADVQSGKATMYSPTQAVYPLRSTLAMLLAMPQENVHVIFRMGSGCYGINGADTVSYDAALLSQAVGKPVRIQLTRKDEMAWENYGLAFVIDQRAGVDKDGTIIVWDHESWSPTLGGRPGANTPGNVVTGLLAGFQPAAFAARSPAPDPANFANNSNAVPSYMTGMVNGRSGGTGKIRSERVLTHDVQSPFFTGPLRSPARLQNTFAHESFLDEVAVEVKADPVEYRLRHLSDPRLIDVVKAAAKAADWEPRAA